MSKRLGIIVALLLVTALAAGCGGGKKNEATGTSATSSSSSTATTASSGPQSVVVSAVEPFAYNPSSVTVKKGTPVELTLKNDGVVAHDLHIDELGVKTARINGGQETKVTFTPTTVGEYKMYCAEPGHEAAGMVGTLIVVD